MAKSAVAFAAIWAITLVAAAGLSVYCTIAYLHYKDAANFEQAAAQHSERANADLQDALDRLRNELAATNALKVERDEAVSERDQLRANLRDVEQRLSMLEAARPDAKAGPAQAPRSAPRSTISEPAAVGSASEPPRQVEAGAAPEQKNFTAPGSVPTYFTNEAEPVLQNSVRRPVRHRP